MFVKFVQADAPSIREFRPWLWGYLGTYTKFGVEPGGTGSARLFVSGAARVIIFGLPELVLALKPTKEKGIHTLVKQITAEDGPKLLKDVPLWHTTIDAVEGPKLLIVPPASYVAMRPIGKDGCAGMRMPFASRGEGATAAMKVLSDLDLDGMGKAAGTFYTLMHAAAMNSAKKADSKEAPKGKAVKAVPKGKAADAAAKPAKEPPAKKRRV